MSSTQDGTGDLKQRLVFAMAIGLVGMCMLIAAHNMDFSHLPAHVSGPIMSAQSEINTVKQVIYTQRWVLLLVGVCSLIVVAIVARMIVQFWRNQVVARFTGAKLDEKTFGFKHKRFDLVRAIRQTPPGRYFVGNSPGGQPVCLTEQELSEHGHVMGQTGTGKTKSVLEPLMMQDMRAGKGVLFMDAKGSSENITRLSALARFAGRTDGLRVLALGQPAQSGTYNPVRIPEGVHPDVVSERVFGVLEFTEAYYEGASRQLFRNLVRLFAGTNDPFCLNDINRAIGDDQYLRQLYGKSADTLAAAAVKSQLGNLGDARYKTFVGLQNQLSDYEHPLLNDLNPSIRLEEIFAESGLVYFSLPVNAYPQLAASVGKIVLQHIVSIAAVRESQSDVSSAPLFSVTIDELNRFAFEGLAPALAMMRSARVQMRLSHQSMGDLEQVSESFAKQVVDNTRVKVLLHTDDADHLEKVARGLGTVSVQKDTVRWEQGPMLTFLNTGDVSKRATDEFVVHPNHFKALAPRGQAYVFVSGQCVGINTEYFEIRAARGAGGTQ